MYDLTENLSRLSPKRQYEISEFCIKERQDAALNAVAIGLKCLNQINGMGLKRLCRLSEVWGEKITSFYKAGGLLYREYPEYGIGDAGDVICNVDRHFPDLSDRRRREIKQYLFDQRKDAQWNAAVIGLDAIKEVFHFGESRMETLMNQWDYDIRDFYQDREDQEPRLKQWIETVGFCFENDSIYAYMNKEMGLVERKATHERNMERQENAENGKVC